MNKVFTIGFTKKTANVFFTLLTSNKINTVIDIRLNNTSQLAGFAKYPDIAYFLKVIANIDYFQDKMFSPEERTLKRFKSKDISWKQYVDEFNHTMKNRNINDYILKSYGDFDSICLLCSEPTSEMCHRSIVAEYFKTQFKELVIINL